MSSSEEARGSYAFVVHPPLTKNDVTLFGTNCVRSTGDQQPQDVVHCPKADHTQGDQLQCTNTSIAQCTHTHGVVLSKLPASWGADSGANEQGVCVACVSTHTPAPSPPAPTLTAQDLVRLTLERSSSSDEGVSVLCDLIDLHPHPTSHRSSFLISDPASSWVVEVKGQVWAAQNIKDGAKAISKDFTIQSEIDKKSSNFLEVAQSEYKWSADGSALNFREVFGGDAADSAAAPAAVLAAHTQEGGIDVKGMMKLLRDERLHTSGAWLCCNSHVSVLRSRDKNIPSCHWLTATPNPMASMFKPIIFAENMSIGECTTTCQEEQAAAAATCAGGGGGQQLWQKHQTLKRLLEAGDEKGTEMVKRMTNLEQYCCEDMDVIVKNWDEKNCKKMANIFEHMASIEIKFY